MSPRGKRVVSVSVKRSKRTPEIAPMLIARLMGAVEMLTTRGVDPAYVAGASWDGRFTDFDRKMLGAEVANALGFIAGVAAALNLEQALARMIAERVPS